MGMAKLEAWLETEKSTSHVGRHWAPDDLVEMFRAFAEPDGDTGDDASAPVRMWGNHDRFDTYHANEHNETPECRVAEPGRAFCMPKEPKPSAGPRRMQRNDTVQCAGGYHDREHNWREECDTNPKCIPVTAPVDARPAPPSPEQIEGYELLIEDGKPAYRAPKKGEWVWPVGVGMKKLPMKCVIPTWDEDEPRYILRPKTPKWEPAVGEWVYCENPMRENRLLFQWEGHENMGLCNHCRPATDEEKYRPGAKVRVTSKNGDMAECLVKEKGFADGYVWISIFGYEDGFAPERVTLLSPAKE